MHNIRLTYKDGENSCISVSQALHLSLCGIFLETQLCTVASSTHCGEYVEQPQLKICLKSSCFLLYVCISVALFPSRVKICFQQMQLNNLFILHLIRTTLGSKVHSPLINKHILEKSPSNYKREVRMRNMQ